MHAVSSSADKRSVRSQSSLLSKHRLTPGSLPHASGPHPRVERVRTVADAEQEPYSFKMKEGFLGASLRVVDYTPRKTEVKVELQVEPQTRSRQITRHNTIRDRNCSVFHSLMLKNKEQNLL